MSDETPEENKSNLTALRMASLRNPSVQPARRRRSLRKIFEAAEREAEAEQEVKSHVEATADDGPLSASAVQSHDPGPPVLSLSHISKTYGQGAQSVSVLRQANLTLSKGQIVGLIGPSGSGKSTLLQITGLLDTPTSGGVCIRGQMAENLRDRERTLLRRDTVGFVYQFHHLLKEFSALENVMMPQRIAGIRPREARTRAEDLLTKVGLSHRLHHRPAKLSGGEQQRVAIARALANRPALLLADEPTGNLDPETAESVFEMLLDLARQEGMAALIATHNLELGMRMDRMVRLTQGQLQEVPINQSHADEDKAEDSADDSAEETKSVDESPPKADEAAPPD